MPDEDELSSSSHHVYDEVAPLIRRRKPTDQEVAGHPATGDSVDEATLRAVRDRLEKEQGETPEPPQAS